MKHSTSFNNYIKKGNNFNFKKFTSKEIRNILFDPEFFGLNCIDVEYTVKSEIGGHKLTEWFNIIKTKTILGKIDYAVFTKEITS